MMSNVKVCKWVADGYPIINVFSLDVSDEDIIKCYEEEFGEVPDDLEITEETVWNKAVC